LILPRVVRNPRLSNPAIQYRLGLEKPENIVKVTDKVLWVIEGKSKREKIVQALSEAEYYAKKINDGLPMK
jgi:hypothetical protein